MKTYTFTKNINGENYELEFSRTGDYIKRAPFDPTEIDLDVEVENLKTGELTYEHFSEVDSFFLLDDELEDFLGFELTDQEQRLISAELDFND